MATESPILEEHGWFRGKRRQFSFTVRDGAGALTNPNGWEVRWSVARGPGDDVLFTVEGADVVVPNVAGGPILVNVAPEVTADIEAGSYWHTLERTDAGAEDVLSYGDAVLMEPARVAA